VKNKKYQTLVSFCEKAVNALQRDTGVSEIIKTMDKCQAHTYKQKPDNEIQVYSSILNLISTSF